MDVLLFVVGWLFERGDPMLFGDLPDTETIAILIPVTAIMGGIAVAIVSILMASRKKELEHKERLIAMEKGIEVPQARQPETRPAYLSNRSGGLVMTMLGIALTIAIWTVAGPTGGVWGLVPLAIGVGLLISSTLEKKEVEKKK
jgi:ABC-type enterobactin transport system permease subunit